MSPLDAAFFSMVHQEVRAAVREELRATRPPDPTPPPRQEVLPGLMTTAEVAERCHAHPVTVRGWIKAKRLPGVKRGKNYLVKPADLEAFLAPQRPDLAAVPDADEEAARILSSIYRRK